MKYKIKVANTGYLLEECPFFYGINGFYAMLGSTSCKECKYNIYTDMFHIECKMINKRDRISKLQRILK